MTAYCTREDVLRELGGDRPTIEQRFDVRKWLEEALIDVTVDTLEFAIPTSVAARIDKRIAQASSRLNTAILMAYQDEPFVPYPAHLVQATAQCAAYESVNTDGTRTDYMREMKKDVDAYFLKIADMKLDLGIVGARPKHRTPGVHVSPLGGGGRRGRGRSGYGGGCC